MSSQFERSHTGENLSMEKTEKTLLEACLLKVRQAAVMLEDYVPFGDETANIDVVQQTQDLLFSAKSSLYYLKNAEKRKEIVRILTKSNCVKRPNRQRDNPVVMEFPVRTSAKSTENIERLKTFEKEVA